MFDIIVKFAVIHPIHPIEILAVSQLSVAGYHQKSRPDKTLQTVFDSVFFQRYYWKEAMELHSVSVTDQDEVCAEGRRIVPEIHEGASSRAGRSCCSCTSVCCRLRRTARMVRE